MATYKNHKQNPMMRLREINPEKTTFSILITMPKLWKKNYWGKTMPCQSFHGILLWVRGGGRFMGFFDPSHFMYHFTLKNKGYIVMQTFGEKNLPLASPHGLWMAPSQDIYLWSYVIRFAWTFCKLCNPCLSRACCCWVFFAWHISDPLSAHGPWPKG